MPITEAQRRANKKYYERNKEVICLHEKVKYWNDADERETQKNASKRSYYRAQIRKIEEKLNELPPETL